MSGDSQEVAFVTDALRREARKWAELSTRMAVISSATGDLGLSVSAFFIGDLSTKPYWKKYNAFQDQMARLLNSAITEFEQMSGVLIKTASIYDNHEAIIEFDVEQLYNA